MGLLHLHLIKPAFLAIVYVMLTFFSLEGGGVSSATAEAAAAAAAAPPSSIASSALGTGDMSASAVSAAEAEATS